MGNHDQQNQSNTNRDWDQNSIRSYLKEQFPQASQDLVSSVTEGLTTDIKNPGEIKGVIKMYNSSNNFDSYTRLKNIPRNEFGQVVQMLERVQKRFDTSSG